MQGVLALAAILLAIAGLSMQHRLDEQRDLIRQQSNNIRAIYNCADNTSYTPDLLGQCLDDWHNR